MPCFVCIFKLLWYDRHGGTKGREKINSGFTMQSDERFTDSCSNTLTENHYSTATMSSLGTSVIKKVRKLNRIILSDKTIRGCVISSIQNTSSNFICEEARNRLTHRPLGDLDVILKMQFKVVFYRLVSSDILMKMPSNKCLKILPMISQHWPRQWLGAIRQQLIISANGDPHLCCHMALLGLNKSISRWWRMNHWDSTWCHSNFMS